MLVLNGCVVSQAGIKKNVNLFLGVRAERTDLGELLIKISISGKRTILVHPFGVKEFEFYIDAERARLPGPKPEVSLKRILARHIPPAPAENFIAFGMTDHEIRDWLGPGKHKLYFKWAGARSNELEIIVPGKGPVIASPTYKHMGRTD